MDTSKKRARRAYRGGWELLTAVGLVLFVCVALSRRVPSIPTATSAEETRRVLPHGRTVFDRVHGSVVTPDTAIPPTLVQQGPLRLLLSTHNRLFYYTPDTGDEETLHEYQVRISPCHLPPCTAVLQPRLCNTWQQ